jgi:hypothetical protein
MKVSVHLLAGVRAGHRLIAATIAASGRTYARVAAPTSLPRTDSARSGGSRSWAARHPNTLSKSAGQDSSQPADVRY